MEWRIRRAILAAVLCAIGLTGCSRYTAMNNGKLSSIDRAPAFAEETVEDNLYLASYLSDEASGGR